MTLYEYPFNERMRTFLRLEDLFQQLDFFVAKTEPQEHHVALTILFDLLDITTRADLKTDLLHELEKQKQGLIHLRQHPSVDKHTLDQMIDEFNHYAHVFINYTGKIGQTLRVNEWLNGIRSRVSIPGGACPFDLPAYHAWQQRPAAQRASDLNTHMQCLRPLQAALTALLRLLREFSSTVNSVAAKGMFQEMLGGKSYQLLRVILPPGSDLYPEISANKYMLSIRFYVLDYQVQNQPVTHDVPFQLVLCQHLA